MYTIKVPNMIKFGFGQNGKIAQQIGLSKEHLSRILNGKDSTKYTTAYCIVKLFNSSKEVKDYFIQK